jgi:hypothetical protein
MTRTGKGKRGPQKNVSIIPAERSRRRLRNDIASYAFVVDAKDDISHASHPHRCWSRTAAADMLFPNAAARLSIAAHK